MVEHSCGLVIGKAYTQLYTHLLTCCSFYLSPRASVTNSELLLHVLHVSIYLLIYLFLENLKQYVSLNYSALGSEVQCGPYKYCKYDWTRSKTQHNVFKICFVTNHTKSYATEEDNSAVSRPPKWFERSVIKPERQRQNLYEVILPLSSNLKIPLGTYLRSVI